MRFLTGLIFSVISSTVAFADSGHALMFNSQHINVTQIAEPEAQSVALFPKKKKSKTKKRNRSMGKKLRRRNDDTLRRD